MFSFPSDMFCVLTWIDIFSSIFSLSLLKFFFLLFLRSRTFSCLFNLTTSRYSIWQKKGGGHDFNIKKAGHMSINSSRKEGGKDRKQNKTGWINWREFKEVKANKLFLIFIVNENIQNKNEERKVFLIITSVGKGPENPPCEDFC